MKTQLRIVACLGLACLVVTLACAEDTKQDLKSKKPPKLEACKLGTTYNVHRLGKIYLAGQPSTDDFAIARKKEAAKLRCIGIRKLGKSKLLSSLGFHEATSYERVAAIQ